VSVIVELIARLGVDECRCPVKEVSLVIQETLVTKDVSVTSVQVDLMDDVVMSVGLGQTVSLIPVDDGNVGYHYFTSASCSQMGASVSLSKAGTSSGYISL
jgi:hypothetical protein